MTREIRLPALHPQFRPRTEGDIRRPSHPGTAVRIGEDLYEVVAAERRGDEWLYRLEPWTGRDTIRAYVEWGEGSERDFAAGRRAEQTRERRNFWTWAGQPLIGFLPARRQERRCQEAGLDPARATLLSAVLETAVALPFAFIFFISLAASAAGGSIGRVPAWAGLPAIVLLAEGVFRLAAVLTTGEPVGSLFLALLDLRSKPEGPEFAAGDEILKIEAELKVVSPVPKVWWERAGGVTYEGEPYVLSGSGREKTRYVYRFLKGGEGFPILDPELEKCRNRASDLSYAFAPLWGFLPPGLQEDLEFYGRYRPRPYILVSVGINVLIAVALAGPGLRAISGGVLETWSLIKLAIATGLFAESALRVLRLLKDGRPSGSVLGILIRPLYDLAAKNRP